MPIVEGIREIFEIYRKFQAESETVKGINAAHTAEASAVNQSKFSGIDEKRARLAILEARRKLALQGIANSLEAQKSS